MSRPQDGIIGGDPCQSAVSLSLGSSRETATSLPLPLWPRPRQRSARQRPAASPRRMRQGNGSRAKPQRLGSQLNGLIVRRQEAFAMSNDPSLNDLAALIALAKESKNDAEFVGWLKGTKSGGFTSARPKCPFNHHAPDADSASARTLADLAAM
jgi:hypothetical protein